MLRTHASLAALAAHSLSMACSVDDGSGQPPVGSGASPPPADPPKPADPPPPAAKEPAAREAKRAYVIWAAPGHETYGVGALVRTSPEMAEALRANGRARPATREEVKVLTADKADIPDLG